MAYFKFKFTGKLKFNFKLNLKLRRRRFWPAQYTFSNSGGEQQRHWHRNNTGQQGPGQTRTAGPRRRGQTASESPSLHRVGGPGVGLQLVQSQPCFT